MTNKQWKLWSSRFSPFNSSKNSHHPTTLFDRHSPPTYSYMEASMNRPKHKPQKITMKRDESEDDEAPPEDDKRKRLAIKKPDASSSSTKTCHADNCTADLTAAKTYHRRHKVCELHAKAQVVLVAGIRQRFCQQCSRFHEVSEFDEAKRSCRRRLAGHNERRRKNPSENSEAESRRMMKGKDMVCGQVDDRGRIQITVQQNSSYKHFHLR